MADIEGFLRLQGSAKNLLSDDERSAGVAYMLDHRGRGVTLVRDGVALAEQTVLVVQPGRSRGDEERGETGIASDIDMLLIGTRGHATLADFDVRKDDSFKLDGSLYTVVFVDQSLAGKTEGHAKAQQ